MALLPILYYPDARLRLAAQPVRLFDAKLQQLVADMAETMYYSNGIGLAATQVNIAQQIFIIDLAQQHEASRLTIFINPRIIAQNGTIVTQEGCLSVPGIFANVTRATHLTLTYQNIQGNYQQLSCSELMAICIQHEIDHLNGKIFVDYLSSLKQTFIKKKLKKLEQVA